MSKNKKKRIIQNQLLIKKFVFWWGIFPTSGGFTLCERTTKKMKILEKLFRSLGFLPHVATK